MFSRLRERLTRAFGTRLAFWYFALFVASVGVLFAVAYTLLSASLRARDRAIVEKTQSRYAGAFSSDLVAPIPLDPLFERYLTETFGFLGIGTPDVQPLRIVYTPLHGVGRRFAETALARAGFHDV
jgi:phosphomannomutase